MSFGALSVVLPARDEAALVAEVVGAALRELSRRRSGGEVIVVDDGSTDPTGEAVAAIGDPRIRLLRHPRPRGYGAALRTGFAAARGDEVFFTDADHQFDLAELVRLERWIDTFPLVVGYRAPRRDPWGRRVLGWAWNRLVDGLFDLGVRDVDCAFKLVRRAELARLGLRADGALVNGELLARARGAGWAVKEVPVSHFPRRAGRASGARLHTVGRAMRELGGLTPELRRARAPGAPVSAGELVEGGRQGGVGADPLGHRA